MALITKWAFGGQPSTDPNVSDAWHVQEQNLPNGQIALVSDEPGTEGQFASVRADRVVVLVARPNPAGNETFTKAKTGGMVVAKIGEGWRLVPYVPNA